MPDYVISVRRIKNGEFDAEPGPTRFLEVPGNELPKPTHQVRRRSEWVRKVLLDAEPGADESSARPVGDVLVLVHGYNSPQKNSVKRLRLLKRDLKKLGYKGAVILFDWPADDRALNYLEDRSDAKKTAIRLVDDCVKLFASIQSQGCDVNLHILAHSTGAYVIREGFDDADDRPGIAAVNWTVSQIAFIGADVSSKSMSEADSKSSSIYRHCVRLTNYSNPFDSVLKLSNIKRIGVAPRVGRIGLPEDTPHNAVNVDCGDYFSTLSEDDQNSVGTFEHSWHIGNLHFTKDLLYTIRGDIDRHRIPTREKNQDGSLSLVQPG